MDAKVDVEAVDVDILRAMSPLKRLRRRSTAETSARTPQATPTAPGPRADRDAPTTLQPSEPHEDMRRFRLSTTLPVLLVRAAHPKQALATALGLAAAAGLADRPGREAGVVLLTVLVGQTMLGWDNDLVDRGRDERHELDGKPIAQGLLDPGTVWFSISCALLLVVPLSLSAGSRAGGAYLIALVIGFAGNRWLRGSVLSFVPWLLSFGLYPTYLEDGGWNGAPSETPATMTTIVTLSVLAGLLGVGIHVLRALPGLVPDHSDGLRSLPLRLALKVGAPRLLVLAGIFTGATAVAFVIAGQALGRG